MQKRVKGRKRDEYSELKGKLSLASTQYGMDVTREQHLLWCMEHALTEVNCGGVREGLTSMLSDIRKHPELENRIGGKLGISFMMLPADRQPGRSAALDRGFQLMSYSEENGHVVLDTVLEAF